VFLIQNKDFLKDVVLLSYSLHIAFFLAAALLTAPHVRQLITSKKSTKALVRKLIAHCNRHL